MVNLVLGTNKQSILWKINFFKNIFAQVFMWNKWTLNIKWKQLKVIWNINWKSTFKKMNSALYKKMNLALYTCLRIEFATPSVHIRVGAESSTAVNCWRVSMISKTACLSSVETKSPKQLKHLLSPVIRKKMKM